MSQDGALSPIFGGETPLQKIDPKKWRQPWRHSMNPVNISWRVLLHQWYITADESNIPVQI